MKNKLKHILPILAATFLVAGIVLAANTFPTTLNDWEYGEVIEEDWANALEDKIGVNGSSVITSLDYYISQRLDDWEKLTANALTPTSTIGIIVNASSTFTGYVTALGFTGNASTSDALKANGSNCITGNYPLGIDASGNVEDCTAIGAAGDGSSNWRYTPGQGAISPTSTIGIIVHASSTFGYINATGGFTGNASTADALKANPSDCAGAGSFAVGIIADGSATCATIIDADVPDTITVSNYLSRNNWFSTTSHAIIESLPSQYLYPAFTYSTTTWVGTTTMALGFAATNETWSTVGCFTNVGSLAFYFNDGTNNMNSLTATSSTGTVIQQTLSTNNSFTIGEKRYITVGSPASSPREFSCTVKKALK